MLGINLTIALKALAQNRLQALLTLCGMSVGVAMVVIVAGLGQGAQATIESQLESAGPTRITVRAGNFVPAAIITTGEQDSSGGEPSEGSDSPLDADAPARREAARPPRAVRQRTPAPPLSNRELRLARTDLPNVRAVAASVEGNVRLADAAPAPAPAPSSVSASASGTAMATGSAPGGAVEQTPGSASPMAVRVIRVHGIDEAWPEIRGWKAVSGRLPTAKEVVAGAPVAVLTAGAARRLWPDMAAANSATTADASRARANATAAPGATGAAHAISGASATAEAGGQRAAPAARALNRTLRVGGRDIRIVGILKSSSDERETAVVPSIHVPLAVAQELLGRRTFDAITVQTSSVASTTSVAKDLRARLRTVRELPEDTLDDFRVETESISALPGGGVDPRLARAVHANVVGLEQASYEEIARSLRQAGRTLTLLLTGAAAVSLMVGGIGVMNIMLVSVAARTREIGLRMAMGARTADVLTQFLAEAVALASLGGLVGLALGAGGLAVARHGLRWATAVSPGMLALALSVAALTGVAFGFGPARRAAELDPVVALRSE